MGVIVAPAGELAVGRDWHFEERAVTDYGKYRECGMWDAGP